MELYEMANPIGRPPRYQRAEELWKKFEDYATWVKNTPIQASIALQGKKTAGTMEKGQQGTHHVTRPLTLDGFKVFAHISDWPMFKRTKKYQTKDFLVVIRAIEDIIRDNQVSGAMANVFNSNLVARLNGISDKQEVMGKDGGAIKYSDMTKEQVDAEARRLAQSILND